MALNSSSTSNTSSTNSTNSISNGVSTPAKTRKAKATRKPAGSTSARSGASRSAAPAEIIFDQLPSPYHPTQPPFIWIDHPEEGERLLGSVYVIRLGVGGADHVELSIDKGPWQKCRLTSGYWWFDWSGIQPGKHMLVSRMRTSDGRWFRTPNRNVDYRP